MSLAICDAPVPKFVVGLDFGTTYSGFAYAHRIDTKDVNLLYDWPCSPRPYCKTQTSLFYTPGREDDSFKLEDWGWAATKKFMESRPSSQDEIGFLANKFKLRLAEDFSDGNKAIQDSFAGRLEVERLVVDYLASISKFIVEHLKGTYGQSFSARDVQWCLTVPAIWSDKAKHKMQVYAEKAKLVRGKFCSSSKASMYPLRIILEPEAASFSCQMELGRIISLAPGDKFLVADVGGGTIDIVVHEKESSAPGKHEVHEVSASSGELGGGTYVDRNFMEFLEKKIGCFRRFCQQEQAIVYHRILMWWLGPDGKCTFNGSCPKLLEVPKKLSKAWKKHDKTVRGFAEDDDYYDEIKICCEQMEAIFDTEVDKTIRLIQEKLDKVDDIKYIFLVGGFASSPYLRSRIKNRFEGVARVVSHPNPGGAICSGAVALGYGTGVVLSRISKHSYGIYSSRNFHWNDPPAYKFFDDDGLKKCDNIFSLFVKKEESVSVNQSVTHPYFPIFRHQKVLKIALFSSSSDFTPMYTTDEGCVELDSYKFDIGEDLHMGTRREVEVTMFFGRSTIEISARRVNFGSNRESEKLYFVEFDAPEAYVNKVSE
ncbi:heat shock 70 kDa protein 12A-like [Selaginella moellendorffii]|uniref:heat shock 70 kDa protein 12A-like n=1 Tax=Selaginella moellendorffii TaxID=88036 RepID=UPI000D1D0F89|nr:heat shock 70 kDa protein 12A-like [Selaginella moellendorffii]|eukprot:XP_024520364.1 heat shock 70 kDa protein 12A-like [Selaginella moellendorffii]